MPNHVDGVLLHTMYGTELSRVRTALNGLRILAAISPHPIQLNRQSAPHGYLGNVLVSTHRQVYVATSTVGMDTRCDLLDPKLAQAINGLTRFTARRDASSVGTIPALPRRRWFDPAF